MKSKMKISEMPVSGLGVRKADSGAAYSWSTVVTDSSRRLPELATLEEHVPLVLLSVNRDSLISPAVPAERVLPFSAEMQRNQALPGAAPQRQKKKVRQPIGLGATSSGTRSVTVRGVLATPLSQLVDPTGRMPHQLIGYVHQTVNKGGNLNVTHNVADNEYSVTSVEAVKAVPVVVNAPLIPALTLGDKIDEELPHEPLVVQYVQGPKKRVAEKASFAPFVNANGSVDGKAMASQISSVSVQPPLRLDLNPQILVPKQIRPSNKGVFKKVAVLMHQISRAVAEGVEVVLVGRE